MKKENTQNNQLAFIGLYSGFEFDRDSYAVVVRSISGLTHDEVKHLAIILGLKICRWTKENIIKIMADSYYSIQHISVRKVIAASDYLRSIGILIPWMDLSVEEIKAYGWAKEESETNK